MFYGHLISKNIDWQIVEDCALEMNFNAPRNTKYSKVYERRQARKLTKLEPNIFSYYFTKELPENVILSIYC